MGIIGSSTFSPGPKNYDEVAKWKNNSAGAIPPISSTKDNLNDDQEVTYFAYGVHWISSKASDLWARFRGLEYDKRVADKFARSDLARHWRNSPHQRLKQIRRVIRWFSVRYAPFETKVNTMARIVFSHAGLLILLFMYSFAGAYLFMSIEGPPEARAKDNLVRLRDKILSELWNESTTRILDLHSGTLLKEQKFITQSNFTDISALSQDMIERRGRERDEWYKMAKARILTYEAALYKSFKKGRMESNSDTRLWTFWGALFYSGTIFTTIGYGHIAPTTNMGRLATMLYAVVGIPLMLVALGDFGKLLTRTIKFFWAFIRRYYYTGQCRQVKFSAMEQIGQAYKMMQKTRAVQSMGLAMGRARHTKPIRFMEKGMGEIGKSRAGVYMKKRLGRVDSRKSTDGSIKLNIEEDDVKRISLHTLDVNGFATAIPALVGEPEIIEPEYYRADQSIDGLNRNNNNSNELLQVNTSKPDDGTVRQPITTTPIIIHQNTVVVMNEGGNASTHLQNPNSNQNIQMKPGNKLFGRIALPNKNHLKNIRDNVIPSIKSVLPKSLGYIAPNIVTSNAPNKERYNHEDDDSTLRVRFSDYMEIGQEEGHPISDDLSLSWAPKAEEESINLEEPREMITSKISTIIPSIEKPQTTITIQEPTKISESSPPKQALTKHKEKKVVTPIVLTEKEKERQKELLKLSYFAVDDEFNLPVSIAMFLLLSYLFVGGALFAICEPTWDYILAFYFCFISISTIGLGDVVPDNPYYMLVASIYIFIGLSLTSMCINVFQAYFRSRYNRAAEKIKKKLKWNLEARKAAAQSGKLGVSPSDYDKDIKKLSEKLLKVMEGDQAMLPNVLLRAYSIDFEEAVNIFPTEPELITQAVRIVEDDDEQASYMNRSLSSLSDSSLEASIKEHDARKKRKTNKAPLIVRPQKVKIKPVKTKVAVRRASPVKKIFGKASIMEQVIKRDSHATKSDSRTSSIIPVSSTSQIPRSLNKPILLGEQNDKVTSAPREALRRSLVSSVMETSDGPTTGDEVIYADARDLVISQVPVISFGGDGESESDSKKIATPISVYSEINNFSTDETKHQDNPPDIRSISKRTSPPITSSPTSKHLTSVLFKIAPFKRRSKLIQSDDAVKKGIDKFKGLKSKVKQKSSRRPTSDEEEQTTATAGSLADSEGTIKYLSEDAITESEDDITTPTEIITSHVIGPAITDMPSSCITSIMSPNMLNFEDIDKDSDTTSVVRLASLRGPNSSSRSSIHRS